MFTTTVYNSSRNMLGTNKLGNLPRLTITSRSSPGDPSITYVLTQAQFDTMKTIHDDYTMQMANQNFFAIPTDYDKYITLLNNLDTVNVANPTLDLLIKIVEKSLIGSMNISTLNETVQYDELQIHLLNNQINDILTNKNTKETISDPNHISGQFKLQQSIKLSKIYSYYIYMYGMPAFGVGFDVKKLQFLQKALHMFDAQKMDEPDAKIVETVVDSSGNEIHIPITNPDILPEVPINIYDISGSVQITMDVRFFNTQIGITKDSSNIDILTPIAHYYDTVTSMFLKNSFTLTAQQFISAGGNVITVGSLSTTYSDFANYIAANFNLKDKKHVSESPIPNHGIFDSNEFIRIITQTDLAGTVIFNNITETLRNLVMHNQFGNRDPLHGTTASNPNDRTDYNAADGFFAGDRFIIPNTGFQITLTSPVDPTYFNGQGGIQYNVSHINQGDNILTTTVISEIASDSALLSRTIQVSLVIELADLST
jgi:hypothetical protein